DENPPHSHLRPRRSLAGLEASSKEARDMSEADGTILAMWPTPWRYEAEGYNSGPCVVDLNGQVIAALFWPRHPAFVTMQAEGLVENLGQAIAGLGSNNLIAAAPAMLEALQVLERALREDSRRKSILADTVEYHIDGQTMYLAINKAREAI